MERRHQRLVEYVQESHQVVIEWIAPGAIEPELVLEADDIDGRYIQMLGRGPVTVRITLADAPVDLRSVWMNRRCFVDRRPLNEHRLVSRFQCLFEITGEGRDAALSRRTGRYKRD